MNNTANDTHAAAINTARAAVAPIQAEMDAMAASHPGTHAEWRAGRTSWPAMDRLEAKRNDAFIEAALRAGADRALLGPRADVDHIARHIAIHG